jgi:hypothetical protein
MMRKFLFYGTLGFAVFFLLPRAQAESVCFSSAVDYEKVKDQLPPMLRDLQMKSLLLASATALDSKSNDASLFEVRPVDQKFQLVYRMKTRMFDGMQKTRYLKQLCVIDGNLMKASLESKGMLSIDNIEIKLNSDNTASVMGDKFVKIDESQKAGVVAKIEKLISEGKSSASSGGPNASAQ